MQHLLSWINYSFFVACVVQLFVLEGGLAPIQGIGLCVCICGVCVHACACVRACVRVRARMCGEGSDKVMDAGFWARFKLCCLYNMQCCTYA